MRPFARRSNLVRLRLYSVRHRVLVCAQLMLQMLMALQQWEAERQKLRAHVRRLCEENAWLRDELSTSQKRLQVAEEQAATLEEQSKHLAFMHEMRQFDDQTPAQQKLVCASSDVCASRT